MPARVFVAVFVALGAVRLAGVAGREGFAAGDVFGGRHGFEMLGVAEGADAALVVDVPSRRNGAFVGEFPGDDVGALDLAVRQAELSVAGVVLRAEPYVAVVVLGAFVDLVEEPVLPAFLLPGRPPVGAHSYSHPAQRLDIVQTPALRLTPPRARQGLEAAPQTANHRTVRVNPTPVRLCVQSAACGSHRAPVRRTLQVACRPARIRLFGLAPIPLDSREFLRHKRTSIYPGNSDSAGPRTAPPRPADLAP